MKTTFLIIVIFLFAVTLSAQSKSINKDEYEKAFKFAVSATNSEYPHIFKSTTSFIENGKFVSKSTEINENESSGHYRITRITTDNGKETKKYQITYGFGNVFCSDDNVKWTISEYECVNLLAISLPKKAESVEYSIDKKQVKDRTIKIYRKYEVFSVTDGKKEFKEEIATIDSDGYFINVVNTEGKLKPKIVTHITKQSWIRKAKFEIIKPPIKE
jgi:hypothetical protein